MSTVITFEWDKFDAYVRREVLPNLGRTATVIGVANGGIPLAKRVTQLLTEAGISNSYAEVLCQRPTTSKYKARSPALKRILGALLRHAPTPITNRLRQIEHAYLSKRRGKHIHRTVQVTEEPGELTARVLLVDDAIDSGASMRAIIEHLHSSYGLRRDAVEILTAAVTQANPMIEPTYAWTEGNLVRFPWSLDAE